MNKPKRIVWFADADEYGVDERVLLPSGSLTDVMQENFDCSNKPLPKIGDRMGETVGKDVNGRSMFSRESAWIVDRVEVYEPVGDLSEYSHIAHCYCKYVPVESELTPIIDGDRNETFYDRVAKNRDLILT